MFDRQVVNLFLLTILLSFMYVNFYSTYSSFVLQDENQVRCWIESSIKREGFKEDEDGITYIFCSDDDLLKMNKTHLAHDTYTDIITFDNSICDDQLAGELYISIDRIRENAPIFGASEMDELHRVMIHGILHLCGYDDKDDEQKKEMEDKEDEHLGLRPEPLQKIATCLI